MNTVTIRFENNDVGANAERPKKRRNNYKTIKYSCPLKLVLQTSFCIPRSYGKLRDELLNGEIF